MAWPRNHEASYPIPCLQGFVVALLPCGCRMSNCACMEGGVRWWLCWDSRLLVTCGVYFIQSHYLVVYRKEGLKHFDEVNLMDLEKDSR
jgi:hypothetical protein